MGLVFLDSGAFSAFTKGMSFNEKDYIDNYIDFIKKYSFGIDVYSNLDVIGDAQRTYKNQKYMESRGVSPIPVFHLGEELKWLKKYVEEYDYIALGGMAALGSEEEVRDLTKKRLFFLDDCWDIICNTSDRMPKCKVHGFGLFSPLILWRYPWYSIDSTAWVKCAGYGAVYVPLIRSGRFFYDKFWEINVSNKNSSLGREGKHFNTLTEMEQKKIWSYFQQEGIPFGKSEFRFEDENYELKENEKWFDKDRRQIEIIIEKGVCNDPYSRYRSNALFCKKLEEFSPSWPWPYKKRKIQKFNF